MIVTARYPEVVRALRALPVDRFLLDGEIGALGGAGRSSFQRLQPRMNLTRPTGVERASLEVPVSAACFDALALDGRDLRSLPLEERKACLRLLLPARGVVHFGDHVLEQGREFFDAACGAARGRRGEEARQPLRRQALPRLAQGQVPARSEERRV